MTCLFETPPSATNTASVQATRPPNKLWPIQYSPAPYLQRMVNKNADIIATSTSKADLKQKLLRMKVAELKFRIDY